MLYTGLPAVKTNYTITKGCDLRRPEGTKKDSRSLKKKLLVPEGQETLEWMKMHFIKSIFLLHPEKLFHALKKNRLSALL